MQIQELAEFCLVGGTALALQLGHRISVHIDLFTTEKFDFEVVSNRLEQRFKQDYYVEKPFSGAGVFCYIHQIKVDLIYYPHPLIEPIKIRENIRMYSLADISAMKINAILGRAAKKDFFDLAEILNYHTIAELMEWHRKKFPSQMLAISIPSALTYFSEADESENPMSLKEHTWEDIKKFIQSKVSEYLR
jgi:predicted nucleotidyltransferase component of viral defense system